MPGIIEKSLHFQFHDEMRFWKRAYRKRGEKGDRPLFYKKRGLSPFSLKV